MASDSGQYDSALLGILQNEGKVAPFLDVILGFLYRRTDFFRVMKTENDKLGFPPGVAYKLLANIFKKYEALATKDAEKMGELKKAREEKTKKEAQVVPKPQENAPTTSMEAAPPTSHNTVGHDERGKEETSKEAAKKEESEVEMETDGSKPNNDSDSGAKTTEDEDDEKEDPEQARQRKELQANPLTYNGAEREAYYWSQNITETDVRVKVPKSIVKGKQAKVDIQKKHIRVSKQEPDGSWTDLVNNELSWEINTEESMWTLSPGEFVHINLEKKQERWWENVFVDEPKINTRKIDCSRPMTDLDDEAQAKIEEMMYNQRQKQMGLPQSHEVKTQEMLRKAWDAEGSPFKGQPFDPSRFSVDPSGMVNFKDS